MTFKALQKIKKADLWSYKEICANQNNGMTTVHFIQYNQILIIL